ncbi:MAG: argininosuccinate synthase, partial [Verrucomicrobia bacterium]|nr:argininosuccinate synthase [Verrucomicrobiota bacterium]
TMYKKTVSPFDAPDQPLKLTIEFEQGIPIRVIDRISGQIVPGSLALFQALNHAGGRHGIGRVDIVENRFVGMRSRGVYETPAGTILLQAHRDLELLTLDREVILLKESLAPKIAQLIYNGFWFSPEKEMLMGAVQSTQKDVTGTVFLTLYKGNVIIEGRTSPQSLYRLDIASMNHAGRYDQTDAKGFIKINALRLMKKEVV